MPWKHTLPQNSSVGMTKQCWTMTTEEMAYTILVPLRLMARCLVTSKELAPAMVVTPQKTAAFQ